MYQILLNVYAAPPETCSKTSRRTDFGKNGESSGVSNSVIKLAN